MSTLCDSPLVSPDKMYKIAPFLISSLTSLGVLLVSDICYFFWKSMFVVTCTFGAIIELSKLFVYCQFVAFKYRFGMTVENLLAKHRVLHVDLV